MPQWDEKNGIAIYVYGRDHNPPHIHAYYAEHEVLLVIETGVVYAGSLPKAQLREALEMLDEDREPLTQEWTRLNPSARP